MVTILFFVVCFIHINVRSSRIAHSDIINFTFFLLHVVYFCIFAMLFFIAVLF